MNIYILKICISKSLKNDLCNKINIDYSSLIINKFIWKTKKCNYILIIAEYIRINLIKKKENPKIQKEKVEQYLPSDCLAREQKVFVRIIKTMRKIYFPTDALVLQMKRLISKCLNKIQKLRNSSAFFSKKKKKEHIIIRHWFNVYILLPPCFSR